MNIRTLLETWAGIKFENQTNRIAIAGLSVAVGVLGALAFGRETIVVIEPPNLTEKVKVGKHSADQNYTDAWGLFFADLLGNVTPGNAEFIKNAIGPFLDPAIYQTVTSAIERQAAEIQREKVSQRFEARKTLYEPETGKTFITGYATLTGPGGDDKRSLQTYEFQVQIKNYRPTLTHIDTYEGTPHTAKEVERMEKREKRQEEKLKKEQRQ